MSCRNKAFTLMELMVVVAIIALLVGLVIVSMRGVRASATRSESLGALRQMALAYGQYTDEHRGRLMPGYIDSSLFNPGNEFEDLTVKLPSGEVLSAGDSQSYVWRLAPYVDDAWLTFFSDIATGARSVLAAEYGAGTYGPSGSSAYTGGISERPSFGLNSIFVGGDSFHGGNIADLNPWTNPNNKIAATRLTEVKNPTRLIVFAPTALASVDDCPAVYEDLEVGFCELRPPYLVLDDDSAPWSLDQWTVGAAGRVVQTNAGEYGDGAGLPIARNGQGLMPVAHLDGSAVVAEISTLSRDMRRWSPFEVGLRDSVDPVLRCAP